MTLTEALSMPVGTPYELDVMVVSAELRDKKAGGKFLCLTVQDESQTLSLNQWAGYGEGVVEKFPQGCIVNIAGAVGKPYMDKPQLNLDGFYKKADNLAGYDGTASFVPSYDITYVEIDYIIRSIEELSEPWKTLALEIFGLNDPETAYLSSVRGNARWQDFITAPAALKHHQCKIHGLLLHTINVVKNAKMIMESYPDVEIDKDRVIFCALIHDLGKINDYIWAPCIAYNPLTLVDHKYTVIARLALANEKVGNVLSFELMQKTAYSLLSHHGTWSAPNEPKSKEDSILHLADLIDARMSEE